MLDLDQAERDGVISPAYAERVNQEIERLRARIDKAGALACQKAPHQMIMDALAGEI